jgi:peroxiredoxin
MEPQKLALLTGLFALSVSSLLATAPVPRKSPELVISEPSGKQTALSDFKGKVVVIEFMLINCPHCMRVAKMISKLQEEMSQRGLQTIGVAFDNGVNGKMVSQFSQQLGVTYPIGYTSSAEVDSYLGRTQTERVMVPQIVVIDCAGMIRAQSQPIREMNLEDDHYLHNLIDGLLRENSAPAGKNSAAPQTKR